MALKPLLVFDCIGLIGPIGLMIGLIGPIRPIGPLLMAAFLNFDSKLYESHQAL